MAKSTFQDVNRENYMKALFLDVQKQAHITSIPDRAKAIFDFIIANPTNTDDKIDKNGMIIKNGRFVIKARNAHKI